MALIPNTAMPASTANDVPVDVPLHFHGAGYRQLKEGGSDFAGVLMQGEWDVFVQFVPAHLPKGTVPGHVALSGHSGGGAMTGANRPTKAGEPVDVILFDAINSACEKEFTVVKGKTKKMCKKPVRCTSNEYDTVSAWVKRRIRADAAALPARAANQKAALQANGTRFLTSEPLDTTDTCSYGFWYSNIKNDIETTITGLKVTDDVKEQFCQNYQVAPVAGPHERVLVHDNFEAALAG